MKSAVLLLPDGEDGRAGRGGANHKHDDDRCRRGADRNGAPRRLGCFFTMVVVKDRAFGTTSNKSRTSTRLMAAALSAGGRHIIIMVKN